MRFKLLHIFLLVALLAGAIQLVNTITHDKLTAEVIEVRLTPPAAAGVKSKFDYLVILKVNRPHPNGLPTVVGWNQFGYCSISNTAINQNNYRQLLGKSTTFRYRCRRFLWIPPDRLDKMFDVYFEKSILTGL